MSTFERGENKEIEICVNTSEGVSTALYYMSQKNKPEYCYPEYRNIEINKVNKNVVSLQLHLPQSDALYLTQKILNQWELENDAAIRIQSNKGKEGVAKIVGFNTPQETNEFPGERIIKVFFAWDRKLTFDEWRDEEG